mgnify:CR=1 FL=1
MLGGRGAGRPAYLSSAWAPWAVVALGLLARHACSLHPYSGEATPPRFGDYEAHRAGRRPVFARRRADAERPQALRISMEEERARQEAASAAAPAPAGEAAPAEPAAIPISTAVTAAGLVALAHGLSDEMTLELCLEQLKSPRDSPFLSPVMS